eukprot:5979543-Amphidinium_carterae.1
MLPIHSPGNLKCKCLAQERSSAPPGGCNLHRRKTLTSGCHCRHIHGSPTAASTTDSHQL